MPKYFLKSALFWPVFGSPFFELVQEEIKSMRVRIIEVRILDRDIQKKSV